MEDTTQTGFTNFGKWFPTLFESTHVGRLPNQTHLIQLIILFQDLFKTWNVDGLLGGPSEKKPNLYGLCLDRQIYLSFTKAGGLFKSLTLNNNNSNDNTNNNHINISNQTKNKERHIYLFTNISCFRHV